MNLLFDQFLQATLIDKARKTLSRKIEGAFHRLIKLDPEGLVS
jgi:hypothetical protein